MKPPVSENKVKKLVTDWYVAHQAYHFAVVQNGMGVHGIADRIGCVPIVVTPEMVGKRIGLFVSVEAKRPGRRGEKDRGMSKHQVLFKEGVVGAGGLSICCDGYEDLALLDAQIAELQGTIPPGS